MIDKAKAELNRRMVEERCRYYKPNAKVQDFIKHVGNGKHFVYLILAANGIGKTAAWANIFANIFWGPQNEFFDYPLFRNWPYDKHLRVVTEANDLGETGTIDKEIKYWWPKGRYSAEKHGKNYNFVYKTDTGFLMDKFSNAQEPKEFESATLGAVAFNEPPSEDIFNACVGRMRRGGILMFQITPLRGSAWIQDRLVDSHDQDSVSVTADIEDACIEHGVRGHLSHKNIERMMSKWDPDERDARAHGKFMHLSSVILGKSFRREHHVVDDSLKPPDGSQWFTVVDPARGKPWAIGLGWVDPRGQIVFDDEYPREDWLRIKETKLTIRDYVDIIRLMEKGKPVETRIIDRHFANARNDYGTTLKRDLSEKFDLDFRDSYACEEEVETGIQKVKDLLGFNDRMPEDTLNFPRLKFKNRCKNIIRACERWGRNHETLKPEPDSPYKDHFDLVRYVSMANLEVWVPRNFEQQKVGYILGR